MIRAGCSRPPTQHSAGQRIEGSWRQGSRGVGACKRVGQQRGRAASGVGQQRGRAARGVGQQRGRAARGVGQQRGRGLQRDRAARGVGACRTIGQDTHQRNHRSTSTHHGSAWIVDPYQASEIHINTSWIRMDRGSASSIIDPHQHIMDPYGLWIHIKHHRSTSTHHGSTSSTSYPPTANNSDQAMGG